MSTKTKKNGKAGTLEEMKQDAVKEAIEPKKPTPEQIASRVEIEHSRTVRTIYQLERQLQEMRAKERALVERLDILQIQQAGQKQ